MVEFFQGPAKESITHSTTAIQIRKDNTNITNYLVWFNLRNFNKPGAQGTKLSILKYNLQKGFD